MSGRTCGCDPEAGTRCQRFYATKDCDYCREMEASAKDVARAISQQSGGWYLVMLAPVRGNVDPNAAELFLTITAGKPIEGFTRVFWQAKESQAFRFPTPEAAFAAQKAGGVEDIDRAWIIYRSH